MIPAWFLRLSRLCQAAVVLASAVLALVLWTAIASYVLLRVCGLLDRFGMPAALWQWWVYRPYFQVNGTVKLGLEVGALAGFAPFVLVGFMLHQRAKQTQRPLYGETRPATPEEMERGGLVVRPKR